MDTTLRNSGIDAIGSLHIGTHIAHLYSDKKEFFDTCIPYIQAGLSNNELCVWIYSNNTDFAEVKDRLSEHIINIDLYIDRGQLIIIPYTEWYLEDKNFNELRVNQKWNQLIASALDQG